MSRRVTADEAALLFKSRGGTLVKESWLNTQKPCVVVCHTCRQPNDTVRYNDVKSKGSGVCKGKCRSNKISEALRLSDADARKIMRKGGWEPDPDEPYPGAGKPWKCRCRVCDEPYPKMLSHVQDGAAGCRHCQGVDDNESEAKQIMLANDHEPIAGYPGHAFTPWPSWCLRCRAKGRSTVTTAYYSRIKQRGHQCRSCRGEKIGDGLRYSDEEACAVMLSFGFEPQVPYPGSVEAPWQSIHRRIDGKKCDEPCQPRLHNVMGGQRGCSGCSTRGPNYSAPGYLYLVARGLTGKIGIGGSLVRPANDRLRTHERERFKPMAVWSFDVLLEAHTIEQTVKKWLRSQGIPYVVDEDMPHGGHTETFSLTNISITEVLKAVRDRVRRDPDPLEGFQR